MLAVGRGLLSLLRESISATILDAGSDWTMCAMVIFVREPRRTDTAI
jgi:hypothetical protein